MTKLTEHFTLEEFTDSQTAARKGIANIPSAGSREMRNLERTAGVMERVRTILGDKPVLISSGYRGPKVNAAVGGSKSSAHMSGLAVDFSCPGFGTPVQICKALQPRMRELGIDQLIHEFNSWVHLGLRAADTAPRHQALTIDNRGTRSGFA
jgi:zinc D-Ala-D-Ala carboxypeptidase